LQVSQMVIQVVMGCPFFAVVQADIRTKHKRIGQFLWINLWARIQLTFRLHFDLRTAR